MKSLFWFLPGLKHSAGNYNQILGTDIVQGLTLPGIRHKSIRDVKQLRLPNMFFLIKDVVNIQDFKP